MKVYYWTPTEEEAKKFETWGFKPHPFSDELVDDFYKKNIPAEFAVGSDIPHVVKAQKEYFKKSNEEDLFVLRREREEFIKFFEEEEKEILDALNR